MKSFVFASFAACVATIGYAQEVVECDWRARADAIVEPWETNTTTFANGNVRLALLDTIEPAAAPFHIMVISPPYDEIGARQCRTIGFGNGALGFSGVSFHALGASYDPATGLNFELPVSWFDSNAEFVSGTLSFTVNQATGEILSQLD